MADRPKPDEVSDRLPTIDLRIPGPWRSPEEFGAALSKIVAGLEMTDEHLVDTRTGRRFMMGVSAHDDEIHELFAQGGRLPRREVDRIASHAVKVHVSGPGGSVDAARAVMDVATALVRAGGFGVFVDNSGNAHGVEDWLALAGDTRPGGLYWAYVNAAGSDEEVWSCGMHCLGYRDAEIRDGPGRQEMGFLLHNFLGYLYQSGNPVTDGDALGDEESAVFRARAYPCTRFRPGSPFHNPYGIFRLEPIEQRGD